MTWLWSQILNYYIVPPLNPVIGCTTIRALKTRLEPDQGVEPCESEGLGADSEDVGLPL